MVGTLRHDRCQDTSMRAGVRQRRNRQRSDRSRPQTPAKVRFEL